MKQLIVLIVADTSYSYHPAIHDDSFVRRKQRRNRTTFTLQQVCTVLAPYNYQTRSHFHQVLNNLRVKIK